MYTLIAQIETADLVGIRKAKERIVLIKNIGAGLPVAWACITPLENTSFQWNGGYALFVTTVGDQVGATVTMMARTQADTPGGARYAFQPSRMFGPPVPDHELARNDYRIDNLVPSSGRDTSLSFGLAQSINGSENPLPLNTQFVPPMQSFTQSSSESVTIWLESEVDAGQIVSIPPLQQAADGNSIRSKALVVNFDDNSHSQTVRYSAVLGRFAIT